MANEEPGAAQPVFDEEAHRREELEIEMLRDPEEILRRFQKLERDNKFLHELLTLTNKNMKDLLTLVENIKSRFDYSGGDILT